jgi:parallel beta-helix repeat protein
MSVSGTTGPCLTIARAEFVSSPGDTISIGDGLYRLTAGHSPRAGHIIPKHNQTFTGQAACTPTVAPCAAVISGGILIGPSAIVDSGTGYYKVTGQTQAGIVTPYNCDPEWDGCNYPEDLFFDDTPLQHVKCVTMSCNNGIPPTLTCTGSYATDQWWFDYLNHVIWFCDNPAGHTVETSVQSTMFAPNAASNVTVQNLTIKEFASRLNEGGGLDPNYNIPILYTRVTTNWVVRDNYFTLNHSAGIRDGFGMQILNNVLTVNGQVGIGGGVTAGFPVHPSGLVVQGNVVTYNNFAHVSPGFGAGGMKWGNTANAVVRGNIVSNNLGNGIHFDVNSIDPLIDGNTVQDNLDVGSNTGNGTGLICEIGEGGCTIRNNNVRFEGQYGAYGIQSSTTSGAQIYCNVVTETANNNVPLAVSADNRGVITVQPNEGGEYVSRGNYVHHNQIIWSAGQRGKIGFYFHNFGNVSVVETGNTVVVVDTFRNAPAAGAYVELLGATPSGFNGVWQVTGSTSTPSKTYTFTSQISGLGTASVPGTSSDQGDFFSANTPPDYNNYHASSTSGAWFVYDNDKTGTGVARTFSSYQGRGADVHGTFDTIYNRGFPSVSITSPSDQALVANPVTITATASDASGIKKVEFYIDWTLKGAVNAAPFNYTWTGSGGAHTVAAMAYSSAGVRNCNALTLRQASPAALAGAPGPLRPLL